MPLPPRLGKKEREGRERTKAVPRARNGLDGKETGMVNAPRYTGPGFPDGDADHHASSIDRDEQDFRVERPRKSGS